jgi:hypothetical protein
MRIRSVALLLTAVWLWLSAGICAATETVYIGMTPTEFTEGFNRAAQIYRLKLRMPIWPAKSGKFSAKIAPGITVSGVGADNGNMMDSVTVSCRTDDLCNEVIAAAALSADPELRMRDLTRFIQRRLSGELSDSAYMELAGLAYTLETSKAQIDFHIRPAPE